MSVYRIIFLFEVFIFSESFAAVSAFLFLCFDFIQPLGEEECIDMDGNILDRSLRNETVLLFLSV